MQVAAQDAEALDAWWTLWHEPWRQAHPGWWRLSQRHAPSLTSRSSGGNGGATLDAAPIHSPDETAAETAAETPQRAQQAGREEAKHDALEDALEDVQKQAREEAQDQSQEGAREKAPGADDHHMVESLLSLFAEGAAECRLGHRWFCRHFGIDAAFTHPRPFPAALGISLPGLPLAPDDLVAAATALGRVGYASHCLTSSRQGLARLFSQDTETAGDAHAWREALRQARARPLTVDGIQAPPPGGSALELQRWALPLMARLIEDAVPGAWARLRLRVDPQCFTLAPMAPATYSPALQRQAWRIWRAAAHPNSLAELS